MDHETSHICGGLPVSTVIAFVTRCHHHQAVTLSVQMIRQDADDPQVVSSIRIPFGPFDDHDTMAEVIATTVRCFVDDLAALQP